MMAATARAMRLTARECEVLRLLAQGMTSGEIGAALGLANKTVQTHRLNILQKMGLHSTTAAVVTAIRQGIIEV